LGKALIDLGDHILHLSLKNASRQKYLSLAFEAFQADVGARTDHLPFVAAAGVRFAQPDCVT
jgi:hypothetical protein